MKAKISAGMAALSLAILLSATALAQVGRIEGDVKKQGQPVTNATIEIVRTDIKGSYTVQTDKKGHFLHAGVPYVGTYTLLVSAPDCAPTYLGGIRPTGEILTVEMNPGDGKKVTIEEVRAAAAGAKSGGGSAAAGAPAAKAPSAEELKKQQAEFEKKKGEIEKQKADFENMKKAFDEGRTLAANKDYGPAIAKFQEAEKLDAEQHVVSANLALALYNRGATQLNAGQRDPAKQDFTDAVAAATRALNVVEPTLADPAKAVEGKKNKLSYLKIRADAESVLAKRFNDAGAATAAVTDYKMAASFSEVPAEKNGFMVKGAQTLFDAGMPDKAVPAFQEILQTDPDNIEALYSLGLAYIGTSNFQEAANTLQKFVDRAPEGDGRVAEAKAVMKDLIVGNNLQAPKADDKAKNRARSTTKKP